MCFGNQVDKTTTTNGSQTGATANQFANTGTTTGGSTSNNTAQNTSASNTNNNTVGTTAQNVNQNTAGSTAGTTAQNTASTTGGPAWLTDAAQNNLSYALGLQGSGFTPYSGQQVASLSPQQQGSFSLADQVGAASRANIPLASDATARYTTAGPQQVGAETIAANMSPYMSQYVKESLAPQLQLQQQQFDTQNKGFDANATSAGAFGDTGWGIGRTNLTQQQDTARTGLIGNAYNTAFNTAIGAGAQDVANKINASTTNAGLAETALNRGLTGANAITAGASNAANLANTFGQQQTAQSQADLNAQFNEFMRQQYQDPTFRAQLANTAIGTAKGAAPTTTAGTTTGATSGSTLGSTTGATTGTSTGATTGSTTGTSQGTSTGNTTNQGSTASQGTGTGTSSGTNQSTQVQSAPDNSGYGMLASLLGTVGGAALGGPVGAGLGGSLGSMFGGGNTGGGSPQMPTYAAPNGAGWAPNPNGGNYSPMYFAQGGQPPVGKPSVVGERGPEAFVPHNGGPPVPVGTRGPQMIVPKTSGTVIPNHALRAAMIKRDQARVSAAPELARALGTAA